MTTFFDHTNSAPGAKVFDMFLQAELKHVASVDIHSGEVTCYHFPLKVKGDEVERFVMHFRRISPLWRDGRPFEFQCFGPIPAPGSQIDEAVPSSVTMAGASPETFEALLDSLGLNKPAAKPAITGLTETAPDMRYRGLGFCDKGDE